MSSVEVAHPAMVKLRSLAGQHLAGAQPEVDLDGSDVVAILAAIEAADDLVRHLRSSLGSNTYHRLYEKARRALNDLRVAARERV